MQDLLIAVGPYWLQLLFKLQMCSCKPQPTHFLKRMLLCQIYYVILLIYLYFLREKQVVQPFSINIALKILQHREL